MEPPSTRHITVINQSGRRIPRSAIRRVVALALFHQGLPDAEVCVLLAEDSEVRRLNFRFRQIDQSTDVLTFPADTSLPGAPLGDIAIAVEYAERQAKARKVSLSQELCYLAIHGALHLAGFDDEEETDRIKMVEEMNRVATAAGLKADTEWCSLLHAEVGS